MSICPNRAIWRAKIRAFPATKRSVEYRHHKLVNSETRSSFTTPKYKEPGIVGIVKVASEPYPDPVQFDPTSRYFDPKSSRDNPRWILVDVEFVRKLARPITLAEIKAHPGLDDMILTRRGNRLSIMPVSKEHWDLILTLE